ncbi:D-alanine--D-alanine ligase family protein [Dethiosulfatarculus sandiegensis]|uniref:D-alanine--D-alanine ligase n=1 Tax=Dethiosulfatarculus sandiegensis TaxID=1429043 RepID=A0A0D2JYD6_9BACT|nr:D-alanine--D-alanine ligase [Dethiosulfatarculus sandiegensis]KIX14540.1 D-alanine--D-alanine ligase [Dethiosulfatarculus sandiegensis]
MTNPQERKLNVAVLLGGDSSERSVSIKSGRSVVQALNPKIYRVKVYDPSVDIPRLMRDAHELDVALIMLHGKGGEDGRIQGMLDLLGIPYQCAGPLGCAVAMHKPMSKVLFKSAGLPVAPDLLLHKGRPLDIKHITSLVPLPVVVKPATEGSSYGVAIVKKKEELLPAINAAFLLDRQVMVEKFLVGREVTAAVMGDQEPEPLPLIEIIPSEKYTFFDFSAKYLPGASQEICPAELDEKQTRIIQDMAIRAHQALELEGYSRSDFILTADGPFILETNTIPGMTETSLLPKAAKAGGYPLPAFLNKLIDLALARASNNSPNSCSIQF